MKDERRNFAVEMKRTGSRWTCQLRNRRVNSHLLKRDEIPPSNDIIIMFLKKAAKDVRGGARDMQVMISLWRNEGRRNKVYPPRVRNLDGQLARPSA